MVDLNRPITPPPDLDGIKGETLELQRCAQVGLLG